jgi:hypothetical protein
MARLKPETIKAKALKLTKDYLSTPDLCKADVARKRGVSRQAITKQINRKPVQDLLKKFLNSPKLKKALIEVGIDGLKAERSTGAAILVQKDGTVVKADDEGGIMIADHNARHKFWHDLGITTGFLKNKTETEISGEVKGPVIYLPAQNG